MSTGPRFMLGIRVTRGCTLHGLALNVDMDLAPFGAPIPRVPRAGGDANSRPRHRRRRGRSRHRTRPAHRPATGKAPCVNRASRKRARPKRPAYSTNTRSRSSRKRRSRSLTGSGVKAASANSRFTEIKQILRDQSLHTVCEEASCRLGQEIGRQQQPRGLPAAFEGGITWAGHDPGSSEPCAAAPGLPLDSARSMNQPNMSWSSHSPSRRT